MQRLLRKQNIRRICKVHKLILKCGEDKNMLTYHRVSLLRISYNTWKCKYYE